MSRTRKERDEVYAILRWDGFHGTGADPEVLVTVKQGARSQELAKAEGAHLNALSEGKGVHYWWQATRLFPEWKSAGSDVA